MSSGKFSVLHKVFFSWWLDMKYLPLLWMNTYVLCCITLNFELYNFRNSSNHSSALNRCIWRFLLLIRYIYLLTKRFYLLWSTYMNLLSYFVFIFSMLIHIGITLNYHYERDEVFASITYILYLPSWKKKRKLDPVKHMWFLELFSISFIVLIPTAGYYPQLSSLEEGN